MLCFLKMYPILERSMMGSTLDTYSGPLPIWGTMRSGDVYGLRMWERPTSESGGYLWATPKARDWRSGGTDRSKIETRLDKRRRTKQSLDLTDQVSLYGDAKTGLLNPTWVEMLMGYPANWTYTGGLPDRAQNSTTTNRRARLVTRRNVRNGSKRWETQSSRSASSRLHKTSSGGLKPHI